MNWEILIDRRAIKDLKQIPGNVKKRIKHKIDLVAKNPLEFKHYALQGIRLKGFFRLRVGEYRVFYSLNFDDQEIVIWAVKHRKDAYKKS